MHKISIITINYNDIKGLERTFNSVFSQNCKDYEYIVIDGGSTDGSKELIEQNKGKITYWVSERDGGVYNAMNKGTMVATGDFVLYLNSGDSFYNPNVLSNILPHLDSGEDLIFGGVNIVSPSYSWVKTYDGVNIDFHFFVRSTLPHQSTFIKKSLLDKYSGPYDESVKISADWKLFILSVCRHNATVKYMPITVSDFHLGGLSSGEESVGLIQLEHIDVYCQYFKKEIASEIDQLLDTERKYLNWKRSRAVRYYFNIKRYLTGKN